MQTRTLLPLTELTLLIVKFNQINKSKKQQTTNINAIEVITSANKNIFTSYRTNFTHH